jgi:hypothetical protein
LVMGSCKLYIWTGLQLSSQPPPKLQHLLVSTLGNPATNINVLFFVTFTGIYSKEWSSTMNLTFASLSSNLSNLSSQKICFI